MAEIYTVMENRNRINSDHWHFYLFPASQLSSFICPQLSAAQSALPGTCDLEDYQYGVQGVRRRFSS